MKFIFIVFFLFGMLNAETTLEDVSKYIAQIPSFSKTIKIINRDTCRLDKGLNKLLASTEGIRVRESFDNKSIVAVLAYDKLSKKWAVFIPSLHKQEALKQKSFLQLNTIEPHVVFYVIAKKKRDIAIQTTQMIQECQNILQKGGYKILIDSGIKKEATQSFQDAISIESRYITQNFKNRYDDTRVALIYPAVKPHGTKVKEHYAPASPKIHLHYNSAYEGKKFYLYDYFTKGCYIGFFPSKNVPPFGRLNQLNR